MLHRNRDKAMSKWKLMCWFMINTVKKVKKEIIKKKCTRVSSGKASWVVGGEQLKKCLKEMSGCGKSTPSDKDGRCKGHRAATRPSKEQKCS